MKRVQPRCIVATLAVLALLVTPLMAQQRRDGGTFGRLQRGGFLSNSLLINSPQVQDELKLSDDQKEKVQGLAEDFTGKTRELFGDRDLDREQRQEKIAEINRKFTEEVNKVLTDKQRQRFEQLQLQQAGYAALMRPEIAQKLKITEDQAAEIRTALRNALQPRRRGGGGGDRPARGQRRRTLPGSDGADEAITALLSDEQKEQWKGLLGEPFEFRPQRGRFGAGFGGRRGGGQFGGGRRGAFGGFGGGGLGGFGRGGAAGPAQLLGNQAVREELKITEEQVAKIDEVNQVVQEASRELFATEDLSDEDRREMSRDLNESARKEIEAVLKDNQKQRLAQIRLQQQGYPALVNDKEVATKLKLTDDQNAQIRDAISGRDEARRELFGSFGRGTDFQEIREKMTALDEDLNKKIERILSSEQKADWKALVGKPFDLSQLRPSFGGRRGGFGRGRGGRGGFGRGRGGAGGERRRPEPE